MHPVDVHADRWAGSFLRAHELHFNEEYHHFLTGAKPLTVIRRSHPCGGWFLTRADREAGEWSLARAFGRPDGYLPLLSDLLNEEYHFLVSDHDWEQVAEAFRGFHVENMFWCRLHPGAVASARTALPGSGLEIRVHHDPGEGDVIHVYLLRNSLIAGMVRTIHLTPLTREVYIEIAPDLRNQGWGTHLLRTFTQTVKSDGRWVLYVVAEENGASRCIAGKCGFEVYQTIRRASSPRASGLNLGTRLDGT